MDLLELQDALASKSFQRIGEICDELMLQVASSGISFQEEWPYSIHLLGHIYVNDLNSARFLWKSIPSGIKESRAEVVAAWKIGQCLWIRDYAGVYAAIRGFNWSPEALGLVTAFGGFRLPSLESTISLGSFGLHQKEQPKSIYIANLVVYKYNRVPTITGPKQPMPTADKFSYGFASRSETALSCCKFNCGLLLAPIPPLNRAILTGDVGKGLHSIMFDYPSHYLWLR